MVLLPLRVLSLKRATAGALTVRFSVLSRQKIYDRRQRVGLELVPLRDPENFKPRPHNRILVPLGGSFQNLRRALSSFLHGSAPTLGVERTRVSGGNRA